jgi:DNA excision repair protein ERCC-6
MCNSPQQTAEFKHMLGEIARLEKGANSRMRGRWVLKDEFK